MTIPTFVIHMRDAKQEPHSVIRRLRMWLKAGIRQHALKCTNIKEMRENIDGSNTDSQLPPARNPPA